jgi:hypothetical protein
VLGRLLMAHVGNDTVAAVRLGGIEGAVGKAQQVAGITVVRAPRRHAYYYWFQHPDVRGLRGWAVVADSSEARRQFSLLTGQWNFAALLQRIEVGPERLGNQWEGPAYQTRAAVRRRLLPGPWPTPRLSQRAVLS